MRNVRNVNEVKREVMVNSGMNEPKRIRKESRKRKRE